MSDSRTGEGMERLLELLADEATEGLSRAEARELEELLAVHPEVGRDSFELVAAAVSLAFAPAETEAEALPASLEESLREAARRWQADPSTETGTETTSSAVVSLEDRRKASRPFAGGWLAAAAALVLAILGWWPRLTGPEPTAPQAELPPPPVVTPVEPPERLALAAVQTAGDAVSLPVTGTEDAAAAAGVSGELLWSTELQQAVLRLNGLAANDPTVSQYQVWIFDGARDQRYPVDGGVFDVPAGQEEILIPIQPGVHVYQPKLFAVTVEKPGGVVVSDRSRIAATAAVT